MSTYVIRPRAWSSATHDVDSRPSCEVWEATREPVDTGLLNADGHPIYRNPEPKRIGFNAGDRK